MVSGYDERVSNRKVLPKIQFVQKSDADQATRLQRETNMSSIQKKSGGWVVRWREAGRASKQHSSQVFETKAEAKNHAVSIDAKHIAATGGAVAQGQTPTLQALVEIHLRQRPNRTNNVEVRIRYDDLARNAYRSLFRKHPTWKVPSDIHRGDFAILPLGQRRYTKTLLLLAQSLGHPIEPGIVTMRLERPRRTPQPNLLSAAQVAQIQQMADEWSAGLGLAVHLLVTYGHRPQSLVLLNQDAYDPAQNTLTLDIKGGDIHRHPLIPATTQRIAAAQNYLQNRLQRKLCPSDPLIPAHYEAPGNRYLKGASLATWYCQCIGAKIHPHSTGIYNLKRYAISTLLQTGLDAKTIASITGHRTPSLILNTYARTNHDAQKRALHAIQQLSVNACSQVFPENLLTIYEPVA